MQPVPIVVDARSPQQSPPRAAGRRRLFDLEAGRLSLSLFDQAVVSGTSFLTSVIVGRFCSPEVFGVYFLIWTVVLFLRVAQINVLSAAYTVYSPQLGVGPQGTYTGSTLVQQLVASGLLSVGLLVGSVLAAAAPVSGAVLTAAWILAAVLPCLLLREFVRSVSFAHRRLAGATVLDLLVAALQVGGVGLLALSGRLTAVSVYGVIGLACGVACLVWWFTNTVPIHFDRARWRADWLRNWLFGRWLLASQVIGCAYYMVPWLLAAMHGEGTAGRFAAALSLAGAANMLVTGLKNYMAPEAARAWSAGGSAELRRVLKRLTLIVGGLLGLFALAMFCVGEWAVIALYGREYAGLGPTLTVLALDVLAEGLGCGVNSGLWAMEKPATVFFAELSQSVVTLAVGCALVGSWGPFGAAVAILAGRVTGLLSRLRVLSTALAHGS